ncbi:hypothetical protein WN55_06522 [Dufourea novaeangliae]|uniref:Uncharacterized protein n=1 Tax=Dufourea novaeangliae TaxID=178035 RepID=A0A154PQ27_DUFNO|nr:hypothetical protein WN55_06522 [Dufourea novaeangliae]
MTESTDDTSDFVQAMIADRKDIMIDGRRLTISAMDKSIRMLFLDYPILDTSLSYVRIRYETIWLYDINSPDSEYRRRKKNATFLSVLYNSCFCYEPLNLLQ